MPDKKGLPGQGRQFNTDFGWIEVLDDKAFDEFTEQFLAEIPTTNRSERQDAIRRLLSNPDILNQLVTSGIIAPDVDVTTALKRHVILPVTPETIPSELAEELKGKQPQEIGEIPPQGEGEEPPSEGKIPPIPTTGDLNEWRKWRKSLTPGQYNAWVNSKEGKATISTASEGLFAILGQTEKPPTEKQQLQTFLASQEGLSDEAAQNILKESAQVVFKYEQAVQQQGFSGTFEDFLNDAQGWQAITDIWRVGLPSFAKEYDRFLISAGLSPEQIAELKKEQYAMTAEGIYNRLKDAGLAPGAFQWLENMGVESLLSLVPPPKPTPDQLRFGPTSPWSQMVIDSTKGQPVEVRAQFDRLLKEYIFGVQVNANGDIEPFDGTGTLIVPGLIQQDFEANPGLAQSFQQDPAALVDWFLKERFPAYQKQDLIPFSSLNEVAFQQTLAQQFSKQRGESAEAYQVRVGQLEHIQKYGALSPRQVTFQNPDGSVETIELPPLSEDYADPTAFYKAATKFANEQGILNPTMAQISEIALNFAEQNRITKLAEFPTEARPPGFTGGGLVPSGWENLWQTGTPRQLQRAAEVTGMETKEQREDRVFTEYLSTLFQPPDVQRLMQYSRTVAQDFINTGQWQGGLASEFAESYGKYLSGLDKSIFQNLLPGQEKGKTFLEEITQPLTPKEQALRRKIPTKVLR